MFWNLIKKKLNKKNFIQKLLEEEINLRNKGDFEGALKILDRIIYLDDKCSHALNNKAGLLTRKKQYNDAIPYLQKVIVLDPNDGKAYNNLAGCLFSTHHPDQAIPLYKKALEKGYNHEGLHYFLGFSLLACNQIHEALNEWELVMRTNPLYEPLLNDLTEMGVGMLVMNPYEEVNETTIKKIREKINNYTINVYYDDKCKFFTFR